MMLRALMGSQSLRVETETCVKQECTGYYNTSGALLRQGADKFLMMDALRESSTESISLIICSAVYAPLLAMLAFHAFFAFCTRPCILPFPATVPSYWGSFELPGAFSMRTW